MNREEGMFPPLDEASTLAEMRAAIERHQMHSPIVRQVLRVGARDRMSAADTDVMLAYFALQALASYQREYADLLKRTVTATLYPAVG